jgi:glyoxylase-like metal-dependent hydrolase (beta-lactamase superfamily II)
MGEEPKRFNVGDIQCTAVSDGTFSYPTGWFFKNVSNEEIESCLREHNLPPKQVVSPYTCLLIKTGKEIVLVDTGADGLAPTTGDLLTRLKTEGVGREEITTVVLTHAHPDHIGGVLDNEGKPAFPNARFVMSKKEWDFWISGPDLSRMGLDDHTKALLVGCAQKNLPPLKAQIDLIDSEKEVVSGVHAIPAPGHTPGHLAIAISSGKKQLLHMVDAVLHPLHLEHPSWRNIFDLSEDGAVRTRQKLLNRAVAENADVLAYHFPFPGLGHIATNRNGAWKWEPADV